MKRLKVALFISLFSAGLQAQQPRLVVQLVVDQLRSDLIARYHSHFNNKGFNRLSEHGLAYHNATHNHANTVTCVGHATIATGAPPAYHGIVANNWYDKASKQTVYCAYDPNYPLLSKPGIAAEGRSPTRLTTTTLSDVWRLANKGAVYAVSYKDRSAITLAGHSGKAFWFDKDIAQATSSTFYYQSLPKWIKQWNQAHPTQAYQWQLSKPLVSYINRNEARFANRFPTFNASFPHQSGLPGTPRYRKFLSMTPKADYLTNRFAIALLKEYKLGLRDNKTDYLAISYSGNDAIGHQFGPNSIECEDNLYRLDQEIGILLDAIDAQVGLNNTIIILTADHGVQDSKVDLIKRHIKPDNGQEAETVVDKIASILSSNWHLDKSAIEAVDLPYIYLNHQIINDNNLSVSTIKQTLAAKLNGTSPVFRAVTMPYVNSANDSLDKLIVAMSVPERSGDLYLVPYPSHSMSPYEDSRVMHGSPWQYDRSVPLVVFNGHWQHHDIYRPVATTDIASTLSLLLSIQKPASSIGKPLHEVLQQPS